MVLYGDWHDMLIEVLERWKIQPRRWIESLNHNWINGKIRGCGNGGMSD